MSVYSQIAANKRRSFIIFALFLFIVTGFFYIVGVANQSAHSFLVFGIAFSLVSTIGSYYYSDKIVLLTVRAVPADKRQFFDFYTVTENLCVASGIPMPKLYVIDDPAPNAFATGRNPNNAVVCATSGLLSLLKRGELEGVIAHELSHVKNYDILLASVVSVLVGSVALISDMVLRSFWWGGIRRDDNDDRRGANPFIFIVLILSIIITPIVATLIQLAISRKREFLSDADGALLSRNPEGLASALEKIAAFPRPLRTATTSTAHLFISNPLRKNSKGNWFASLFSTHPPTEERIRILRSM